MRKQFDSASCPTCDTLFERLPVEYDEDGGYVFLEVHPCAGCGQHALRLLRSVPLRWMRPDVLHRPSGVGPGRNRALCTAAEPCAAECEPLELPARIPPQSEVLAPRTWRWPEMTCEWRSVSIVFLHAQVSEERPRSLAHALLKQSGERTSTVARRSRRSLPGRWAGWSPARKAARPRRKPKIWQPHPNEPRVKS